MDAGAIKHIVYATLDSALQALDDALAAWMKENVGHE
jgi:hypothetical protein